ncbi:glutathione S-transferase family protein [Parasedimentitalea marina]|uniref:Glutathione S-transferase family protein n=1 Tax=Parasedimentitalea marina TaxID=2483033 RepID=A0A3T0N3U3_9RHOB|nr:glutathione S-transferase family protein [Parasedimentitalea marina]AZV78698.1 glutathione S-transferase family protein [Parasedimentitalea marina]
MGLLQDGKWVDKWYDTKSTDGRYVRKESAFRNWVTADGSAGPSGISGFMAERDRYHLYVSLACPWAHRTLIFRALKSLEEMIPISNVHWFMGEDGWTFAAGDGSTPDPINNTDLLHQVYTAAKPDFTGRVTVPVLWDKHQETIVSNESAEIIRMFNSAFDGVGAAVGDYYPDTERVEIDALNARIYDTLNNGVYKAGFATTQRAYEEAVTPLFETLDWLDNRLSTQRYLMGTHLTEADWRLFTTLIRFDPVYVGHFKCNLRQIADYPHLSGYVRDLYQHPRIAETVDIPYIKKHYYGSHESVNPTRVVPMGPAVDFSAPHNRADFNKEN